MDHISAVPAWPPAIRRNRMRWLALWAAGGALLSTAGTAPAQAPGSAARDLFVTVGKSLVVESPVNIQRIAVGDAQRAEAIAVSPRELLINGKQEGETSVVVWQQGGNRLLFDLHVRASTLKLDAVRQEIAKELPGQNVSLSIEDGSVFLRGVVKDLTSAERAANIAGTLGKPVNLLNVSVPPVEEQILLRVKFANVDRAATLDLGANFFSTRALNTIGSVTTQSFSPPRVEPQTQGNTATTQVTFTDLLNVFLFRPDLNFGATVKALQAKRLLEILAEPNVLAINGKPASFLAGGEFPVPIVQAGVGGAGAITIQWREFGIRLNFTPTITPRGTIRLKVGPEVSSLDFANALNISGFTVPAISTRRVLTEVELENGQSFGIAGLLDNRVTDTLSKIPGLGDIPLLGKLFQSKSQSKNNTELLVLVTPELVRPIPAGAPVPNVHFPMPFLKDAPSTMPRTPGINVTGPVPNKPLQESVPVEALQALREKDQAPATAQPAIQLVPMQLAPAQAPAAAPPIAPSRPATPQTSPQG